MRVMVTLNRPYFEGLVCFSSHENRFYLHILASTSIYGR